MKPTSRISWARHNLGIVIIAQIIAAVIVLSGHFLLNVQMHGLQTELGALSTANSALDDVQNSLIAARTAEQQYVLTREQARVDEFYRSVSNYESGAAYLRESVANLPRLAPIALQSIPLGNRWINLYGTPQVVSVGTGYSIPTRSAVHELSLINQFNNQIADANAVCNAEVLSITKKLEFMGRLALFSHFVLLFLTTVIISILILRYVKSRNKLFEYERVQLVEHLAASMAHEIRNPLQVTRGFMQLIKEQVTDEQLKQYLNYAVNELDSAHHILSEYLALSKPDSHEYRPVPLKVIVDDVAQLLTAYGNEYGCAIEFRSDEMHGTEFNSQKLKQVLLNIGKNAIEAMGHGGVLTLSVESSRAHVDIRIQDCGPGIPHEQLARLGQPFFTTKATGTGIGLMIAYRLVEELGGKISVESTIGKGTLFAIRLPQKPNTGPGIPAQGNVAVSPQ